MKQGIVVAVMAAMVILTAGGCAVDPVALEAERQETELEQIAKLREAVAPVREGRGVPQAAAYTPGGSGPHQLVIVPKSGELDESEKYDIWNYFLPSELKPTLISDVALVIVVVDQIEVDLGTQQYSDGPSITRYRHDCWAEVRIARTGKFLGGLTVKGGEPDGFPIIAPRDQTRIAGPIVDHAQFVEALRGYLKSDAPQTGGPTGRRETNRIGMTFVELNPGSFTMGSPDIEVGRDGDEALHPVTLTKGFWMQTTEVTQAQWVAVMGNNPPEFKGADRPVELVSWNSVQEFIRKLNTMDSGQGYRLPTEAEWEYACRAGTMWERYGELGAIAWHSGNSGHETHPVGKKQPNAWGLYDMIGNVEEWCADIYRYDHLEEATNPVGPQTGSDRVYRGGSYESFRAGDCRSAKRGNLDTSVRGQGLGFRLARSSP